jgi:hypothetical protein
MDRMYIEGMKVVFLTTATCLGTMGLVLLRDVSIVPAVCVSFVTVYAIVAGIIRMDDWLTGFV